MHTICSTCLLDLLLAHTMEQLPYYLFLALLPLLFLLSKLKARSSQRQGLRLPPGPWQLPVFGSLHHMLGALPHSAMRDLSRRYGPVMLLRLGEVPTVVISSRDAARELMKTHDLAFATRPLSATMRVLSNDARDIICAPYGDYWRQMRKIAVTELLSARRVQSFRPIRQEEVANMLHAIASSPSAPLVNLGELLSVLVNDETVRAVMGDRCKDRDVFLREVSNAANLAAGFNPADLWPSSRLVGRLSGVVRKAEKCRDTVFHLIDGIIQEHLKQKTGDAEAGDLLDVLLRIHKEGGLQFPLTMDSIKPVIFDIFGAGSETSATTLKWAMAELMKNPRVMEKAKAEVRQAFQGQGRVDECALGDLKYLHLVIRETFRLHPPVPLLLPRECMETRRVLGYDVPKGATVLVNAWALGRDPAYWDESEVFKPERFESSAVDFRGADFELLPFGAGRRMCPGMSFGLANVELALASLLFHFDWEIPRGIQPSEFDMTEAFGITTQRKAELWLHAIPRVPLPTAAAT